MCNAFIVFESLQRLGSKADRVLLYPNEWNAEKDDPRDRNSQLLFRAKKSYGVKLKPTQLLGLDGPADPGTLENPSGYEASITKLRLFELDEYERVLHFDSDVMVQQHLDELFFLPATTAAMPRAYWFDSPWDQWSLSTSLIVLQPNAAETKRKSVVHNLVSRPPSVMTAVWNRGVLLANMWVEFWDILQKWRLQPEREATQSYDDDLFNERFSSSAMVLPHRPYILQTNEFRKRDHSAWLGSFNGPPSLPRWDAFRERKEAKLIHFSDWPLPKPWIMWPSEGLAEMQPDCGGTHTGTCAEREIWKDLYDEFRRRRKDVCKILSVPAPQNWEEYRNKTGAN